MDFQSIANKAYELAPVRDSGNKNLKDIAFFAYKIYVESYFPDLVEYWPVIAGTHYKIGNFDKYYVVVLIDQGPTSFIQTLGIGNIKLNLNEIDRTNPNMIRKELFSLLNLKKRDAIFLFDNTNNYSNWNADLERDLKENFLQHKMVMNMEPMKIFLSHKSINKDKVRNFKTILELLGFSPWLDEEAMSAGANLERSLHSGMVDSCAAIFFITPDYKDEKYLATEIDYAISRKRQDEKFSIITLVFSDENGEKGVVPNLLQPYVWKEPANDLLALAEILKALPLEVGDIRFK
ncbi:toll/interleukin-1 receptor domain-containing protein [Neisseria sp. 27098_8_139]|uniref:toll/interleukin-1 receptor domain-containing protein n=1 Tax=Neisseria sp. 27098_8_139 TaxID=3003681 RepID=UPI00069EEC9B